MHLPTSVHVGIQVPDVAAHSVLHDSGRFGRTPNLIGRALKVGPKVRVEPGDVIHVQMRKAQVIDLHDFTELELRNATIAAIEQKPVRGLTGVDANQQRVVIAGFAQNFKLESHASSVPVWDSVSQVNSAYARRLT